MPYTYKALDLQAIRLLKLLPGSEDDIIQCHIESFPLPEAERRGYEAVSYTWGFTGNHATIELEGCPISIQANLGAFLKVLRLQHASRYLWVDAVCIDQANVLEKNVQVQLMQRIYRRAAQVLVWLGPHRDGSDLVFDFCNQPQRPQPDQEIYRPIKSGQKFEGMHESDVISQAIEALLYREYWQRLWVVQEVLLAQEVTIYCGNNSTSWKRLISARDWLVDHQPVRRFNLSDDPFEQTHFGAFDDLCEQRKSQRLIALELCIFRFGDRKCTDIRDRVFGLLGVASDMGKIRELEVDYSIDVEELFFRVMCLYPSRAPLHFCLRLLDVLMVGPKKCLTWTRAAIARSGPLLGRLDLTEPYFICQLRYSGLLEYDLQVGRNERLKSQHSSCGTSQEGEQEKARTNASALLRYKVSTFYTQSFKRWGHYIMHLSTKASVQPGDTVYHFAPSQAALIYRRTGPTQHKFIGFAFNIYHRQSDHQKIAHHLEESEAAMAALAARLQIPAGAGIEDEVEARLNFLELIMVCTDTTGGHDE